MYQGCFQKHLRINLDFFLSTLFLMFRKCSQKEEKKVETLYKNSKTTVIYANWPTAEMNGQSSLLSWTVLATVSRPL